MPELILRCLSHFNTSAIEEVPDDPGSWDAVKLREFVSLFATVRYVGRVSD